MGELPRGKGVTRSRQKGVTLISRGKLDLTSREGNGKRGEEEGELQGGASRRGHHSQ